MPTGGFDPGYTLGPITRTSFRVGRGWTTLLEKGRNEGKTPLSNSRIAEASAYVRKPFLARQRFSDTLPTSHVHVHEI